MATTFTPPLNLKAPTIPEIAIPSNPSANPLNMVPPLPLPQTTFGTTAVTSYST